MVTLLPHILLILVNSKFLFRYENRPDFLPPNHSNYIPGLTLVPVLLHEIRNVPLCDISEQYCDIDFPAHLLPLNEILLFVFRHSDNTFPDLQAYDHNHVLS